MHVGGQGCLEVARGPLLQPREVPVVHLASKWESAIGGRRESSVVLVLGMMLAGVGRVSPSPAVVSLVDALPGPHNYQTAARPTMPFSPAIYSFGEVGNLADVRRRPVQEPPCSHLTPLYPVHDLANLRCGLRSGSHGVSYVSDKSTLLKIGGFRTHASKVCASYQRPNLWDHIASSALAFLNPKRLICTGTLQLCMQTPPRLHLCLMLTDYCVDASNPISSFSRGLRRGPRPPVSYYHPA